MKKSRFGILTVIALLAIVSIASAALPAQVWGKVGYEGTSSYFDFDVTSQGSGELVNGHYVNSWCVDANTAAGHYITPGASYLFDVKSSINPYAVTSPMVNWQAVNYVINNKGTMDKYTIQRVLWFYDGDPNFVWGSPDMTKVAAAISATNTFLAAHPDWKPTLCGQNYAVILDAPDTTQLIMVERPLSTCVNPPPAPEFPTVALPFGMIVGVIGLVYVIKGREN